MNFSSLLFGFWPLVAFNKIILPTILFRVFWGLFFCCVFFFPGFCCCCCWFGLIWFVLGGLVFLLPPSAPPICNNHLKASLFHLGLNDCLHLQSTLWYSLWKALDHMRCFTGRQWQCRKSKATSNFLLHALLILISRNKFRASKIVLQETTFQQWDTVTETIQSKVCQIKWQGFNWTFISKTGQMASVALPVFYWSRFLESFIQTMVWTKRRLGSLIHAIKASFTLVNIM